MNIPSTKEFMGFDPMAVAELPLAFDPFKIEGKLLNLTAPEQGMARYEADLVPESPESRKEGGITDGDEMAKVDKVMSVVADYWMKPPEGMPALFLGDSCSMSCINCYLGAAMVATGCQCKANCVRGALPTCAGPAAGWSNEQKSKPTELWESQCNTGTSACESCMDKKMMEDMDKCKGSQYCLQQVRNQYSKDFVLQETVYCTRPLPSGKKVTCEVFLTPPPHKLGWSCHERAADCWVESRSPGYEETLPAVSAPSVWESVPTPESTD